jgi:hypothetical protein
MYPNSEKKRERLAILLGRLLNLFLERPFEMKINRVSGNETF